MSLYTSADARVLCFPLHSAQRRIATAARSPLVVSAETATYKVARPSDVKVCALL